MFKIGDICYHYQTKERFVVLDDLKNGQVKITTINGDMHIYNSADLLTEEELIKKNNS